MNQRYPELKGKCKTCLGCNQQEQKNFVGTYECKNYIDCRTDVLKFVKKRLDDITIADFYDSKEYELIRKEYKEIAELIRDKDKLMELKEKHKKLMNKNVNKYFDR